MRHFTCLLVAICISASVLFAAQPDGQKITTPEKQQASKPGTQNPEAYALSKGRSYWDNRTVSDP
jgi:hypothetical protein